MSVPKGECQMTIDPRIFSTAQLRDLREDPHVSEWVRQMAKLELQLRARRKKMKWCG
jgi:hypothetical protein